MLRAGRPEFYFRQGHRFFPSHPRAHPASYAMGTGAIFPGVKRSGRKSDDSPPPNAEVKNAWGCTSTP